MTNLVVFLADTKIRVGRAGAGAIDVSAELTVDNRPKYFLGT